MVKYYMKCLCLLVGANSHGSYVGKWIQMDSGYLKHMHQERKTMVAVYPLIFYFTNITHYKHRYVFYKTQQYKLMLHMSNIEVLQACLLPQAKQDSLTLLTIILNALIQLCEEYCFVGCDAMCLIKIYTSNECASIFSYLFYREDGESMFPWKITNFLPTYTELHCRRHQCS